MALSTVAEKVGSPKEVGDKQILAVPRPLRGHVYCLWPLQRIASRVLFVATTPPLIIVYIISVSYSYNNVGLWTPTLLLFGIWLLE